MSLAGSSSLRHTLLKPSSTLLRPSSTSISNPPSSLLNQVRSASIIPFPRRGTAKSTINAVEGDPEPPYPPGPERFFKAANRGLYGHVRRRTGNNVSEEHQTKTLRRWHPNVHNKRLWSECLERFVRVRLVIRVLRTIDKVGGLDRYLLGQTPGRVKELGATGWALRWRMLRTQKGMEMWEEERRRLGLEGRGPRDEGWVDPLAPYDGRQVTIDGLVEPANQGFEEEEEVEVRLGGEEQEEMIMSEEMSAEDRERRIDEAIEEQDGKDSEGIDLTGETVQPNEKKGGVFGWLRRK